MSQNRSNPVCKFILILALSLGVGGCVAAPIILAVGAVGGYAVSRDTFEGVTNKAQDEIWEAANRVASIMGTVDDSDRRGGQIMASINGANVVITVMPVNLTNTRLRVKARKLIFPRIGVAQEVYSKIMIQTEQ